MVLGQTESEAVEDKKANANKYLSDGWLMMIVLVPLDRLLIQKSSQILIGALLVGTCC